ncbi:O-antigen ligase family protein [Anatilimnocola floriformis]|uniref:O-antigen ligase family protein n=1 Tax=Anatilimnocola floriformis TaxID=2948575 RepID=UPI0020C5315D|nr:O-antigen ligase family protein [Anatilimnocola floriformis]
MKRRRGQHAEENHPTAESAAAAERLDAIFMSYLRPAILAIATALLVSTPLIASESVISEGAFATWHVMWLAVAVISLVGSAFFTSNAQRWSWADLLVILLVGWHVVSAAMCDGNMRNAWNATWQWGAYGAIAIIFRQQLTSALETRALVVVLLALAVGVSLHAYYDYGVLKPQLRAQFEKDPEKFYKQMGADPGSPTRAHLENRIKSVEPTAEFALTNSLAGYLLPWLILPLGIAFWTVQKETNWKVIGTFLGIALLIFGVLLLTKSRTAVLAAAGGCVLLLLYGRRSGWRLDWRWPAGIAAAAVVLGLIAVAAKGLDAEVLSESPKSLLYRIEYWRGTAGMIADAPLFGVGPGNFKERYVNHKLPEASESITDPHNFLLEIWSTAGTPALLLLIGLMVVTAWQVSRRSAVVSGELALPTGSDGKISAAEELKIGHFAIYAGSVLGLLLAGILGFVVMDPLETTRSGVLESSPEAALGIPLIWLSAFVSFIVCFVGLQEWVNRGELPRAAVVIALIALLVNLLAAGAAIFPGVTSAAWLLWAIALQRDEPTEKTLAAEPATAWKPEWTKYLSVAAGMLFVAALIGCYYTEYQPVLQGQMKILEAISARDQQHVSEAATRLDEAIAADPWSPMSRRLLADFRLRQWLGQPRPKAWGPFIDAMELYEKSSPHHFSQHEERGQWLLLAGRKIKDPEKLKLAAEAYQKAIDCYPNSSMLHAQLASILAEIGDKDHARSEADEAARLDALCPHSELKLEKRVLFDPPPSPHQTTDGKLPSAATVVAELRGKTPVPQPPVPSS